MKIVSLTNNPGGRGVGRRPEEDDLAHRIQRLVFRLGRELRSEDAILGVSSAEAMVLFDLRRHPEAGVSDLADLQRIARSVMSERVKRLEALGLVRRDAARQPDRRRVGLKVTSAGNAVLARITRARRDRMAVRLATLSDEQRRAIETAVDALDRLPEWRSPCETAGEAEKTEMAGGGHPDARRGIRSA